MDYTLSLGNDKITLKCVVNMRVYGNNQNYISVVIDSIIKQGMYNNTILIVDEDNDSYFDFPEFVDKYGSDEDRLKFVEFIEEEIEMLLNCIKLVSTKTPTKSARNV
jgi:hypothetical protein